MRIRHTLSSLYVLSVFVGLMFTHFGCDGVYSPDKEILPGENSSSLPDLTLTSLTDSSEPALVGIGSTFNITWKLTGTVSSPVVQIYLTTKENFTDSDLTAITPSSGVDGNTGLFAFSPVDGQVTTGTEYYVVVKLFSGGQLFSTTLADQQIRVSDGGIVIKSPSSNQTLARGLPVTTTWELTNNICKNLKDKAKVVRIYVDTTSTFNESTAIEVTGENEEIDACLGTYTIKTGEIKGLNLGTPYYVLARLYIDGIEASRSSSAGAFTTTSSLNVTAPSKDVTSNFQSIPVSWEVVGRSAAGLKVEILARISGATDDVDRIISAEYPADQNQGLADASKLPVGNYQLVVRLFERDNTNAKVVLDTAAAPGLVIIPTGYNGSYDLAAMSAIETTNYSPVNGVVFEGYDINDQLGFEVAGVGDVTGDGYSDFLIFSRYNQQYTTGNGGGGFLIHGKATFDTKVVNVNSVGSPSSNRPVDGTVLLFPMENLATAETGTGKILGDFTAIGLPDVSNDGKGDLLVGCPDASPLNFEFNNPTSSAITFVDQYGLSRTIPNGTFGYEPAHVQPGFTLRLPQGSTLVTYYFNFGSAQDDNTYLPGDKIVVDFSDGPSSDFHIEHNGLNQKRGAIYLLPSQRLNASEYLNKVYDLAKVGSPIEDGLNDPTSGWSSYYIRYLSGFPERSEMITWDGEDGANDFGRAISVMADITSDNYPELLISVPSSYAIDSASTSDSSERSEAGIVKFLGTSQRHTSLCGNNGTIAWMWPQWELALHLNGTYQGSDGQDYSLDIIGAQTGSHLTGAAGLGHFVNMSTYGDKYVNGDFNGDEVPDLVVGAPGENAEAGCVYVLPARPIFGRRDSIIDLNDFNKSIPVGTTPSLEVPIEGVKIVGTIPGEKLGEVVKPAGDFNGDGLADVMFATPQASANGKAEAGRVFIMFGQKDQIGDFTIDQVDSHLGTQLPALIFEGENEFDHFGARIAAVYDVNGDGYDDILIAAPDADAPGKIDCGKIYLIYGKKNIIKTDPATGFKFVDYNNDNQPDDFWSAQDIGVKLPGAVFIGETAGSHLQAISPAGDVNKDGIGDFLIGSPNTDVSSVQKNAGKAYLIFGEKYVLPN